MKEAEPRTPSPWSLTSLSKDTQPKLEVYQVDETILPNGKSWAIAKNRTNLLKEKKMF